MLDLGVWKQLTVRHTVHPGPDSQEWYVLTPFSLSCEGFADCGSKDGKRQRPFDTVKPLAQSLGLTVDTSCDRDDPKCVKKAVNNYDGDGNILICWEHDGLTDIAQKLGDDDAPTYPDGR